MLVARDPLTNTFVNAFDYKHMSPEERPNGLLCPGVCFDGHRRGHSRRFPRGSHSY